MRNPIAPALPWSSPARTWCSPNPPKPIANRSTLLLTSSKVDDDFEWHAAKASKNYRDHGVTFDLAIRAFSDPFAIAIVDEREDYGEERCNLLGMVEGQLLNVAYVERSGRIRLISARRATKKEKDDYFTKNSQT